MSVTDLREWRRRRAEARAVAARHPSVVGGPHAEVLEFINRQMVPQGYRAGLWRPSRPSGTGPTYFAHIVKPVTTGYVRTRCGLTLSEPRRADPDIVLCRGCYPS